MRRRLIVAIVAVVAGALLVAGGGTLALERQAAAQAAQDEIATQVRTIANEASFATRRGVLARIRRAARLSGAKAIRIGPDRTLEGQPPRPLTTADLHRPQLLTGHLVSGTRGDLAYAAVRVIPNATSAASRASRLQGATTGVEQPLVLVITRRFSGPVHGLYYLLIAVGGTLLAAVLVAAWLARRVTRPLQEAVNATRRIAAGDLAAAVPEAPGSYPELASLTSSINTMVASLNRSRNLERQFLLSVSHDLRTPLTSIRGFAEAIAEGATTDPVRAATVIAGESRRLERLVQDLLELARLDARHFSLETRRCDLSELATDTAEGFRLQVEEAGLSLDTSGIPEAGLWVDADPDRLAQVLANLVENAYKFAHHRVTVRAGGHRGQVRVAVTDDGPGIATEDLALVFDRLYQSGRAPARQSGSGLGLAIVAELAHAMGADVRARSPVTGSGGTQMVLTLPAAEPHPRTPTAPPRVWLGPTPPRAAELEAGIHRAGADGPGPVPELWGGTGQA